MAADPTRFAGRTSRRFHCEMSSRANGVARDCSNYSETIRSTDLINSINERLLDKGVQKLEDRLSELPGGKLKRTSGNRNASD